ncbi:MAG TPA: rhomboid family intramembrane serine protease [Desulfomonilaceae bacterium]|nr:rhomboid family intramembrane serine protease [Desulfomonilaceae bacterium]HVN82711.1 rhomboid family intramembrane serine protease [Terriglobia bacterium]
MLSQRLQWKLKRWLLELEQRLEVFRNLMLGARVSTRMCPSCRALVGVGDRTCSFCGARLRRRPSGLGKVLQNVLPHYAPISYSLLGVNFLLFVAVFYSDSRHTPEDLGVLLRGPSPASLVSWGADAGWLVAQGQVWRLVSAIFLHAGILHLLFNCYALVFIGPLLEELLGKERFLALYLATGVFGYLLSNAYYPPFMPTVGASGAIFGLIGAAVVLSRRWGAWGSVLHQQLVHWAIYGFVYGLLLGANNAAHLGGALSGAGIAFLLPNPNRSESNSMAWSILYWLSFIIIASSLTLAVLSRLSG